MCRVCLIGRLSDSFYFKMDKVQSGRRVLDTFGLEKYLIITSKLKDTKGYSCFSVLKSFL